MQSERCATNVLSFKKNFDPNQKLLLVFEEIGTLAIILPPFLWID